MRPKHGCSQTVTKAPIRALPTHARPRGWGLGIEPEVEYGIDSARVGASLKKNKKDRQSFYFWKIR